MPTLVAKPVVEVIASMSITEMGIDTTTNLTI